MVRRIQLEERSVRDRHFSDRYPDYDRQTCQQIVSSDPTRGLASHHGALSRKLAEQG
jgi:hypothetical protein